jgi:tRNA(fMet)-specific endonuclease VapC
VRYLLDTNAVIALLRRDQAVEQRARRHRPDDFGLSSIVAYELFFGAYKSARRSENLARLDGLPFSILDFDAADARAAGSIRALLASAGQPIGPYDILIAGQALARRLILVTRNVSEFERVEGLRVENWER